MEGSKALITGNHRCQWLANYCITVYTDILLSKNDNGTHIGQGTVFFSGLENAKKKEHIGTAPHFEKENAMPKFLRGSSPTPTNVWAKNLDRSFFWLRQTVFKKNISTLETSLQIYIYNPPPGPYLFVSKYCKNKLSGELLLMDKHPAPPDMYETLHKNGHLPYHLVQDFFHQQYWSEYVLFQLMVNGCGIVLGILFFFLVGGGFGAVQAPFWENPGVKGRFVRVFQDIWGWF